MQQRMSVCVCVCAHAQWLDMGEVGGTEGAVAAILADLHQPNHQGMTGTAKGWGVWGKGGGTRCMWRGE